MSGNDATWIIALSPFLISFSTLQLYILKRLTIHDEALKILLQEIRPPKKPSMRELLAQSESG